MRLIVTFRVLAISLVVGLVNGCAETEFNSLLRGGTHNVGGTVIGQFSAFHTKGVRVDIIKRYATRLCSGDNYEMKIVGEELGYHGWVNKAKVTCLGTSPTVERPVIAQPKPPKAIKPFIKAEKEAEKKRIANEKAKEEAARLAAIEAEKKRIANEKAKEEAARLATIEAEKKRAAAEKEKMRTLMIPLKRSCSAMGFKEGSKKMSKCVFELYKLDKKARQERDRAEAARTRKELDRAAAERANQIHRQNIEILSQHQQLEMIKEQNYQACVRRECAFWLTECINSRRNCFK